MYKKKGTILIWVLLAAAAAVIWSSLKRGFVGGGSSYNYPAYGSPELQNKVYRAGGIIGDVLGGLGSLIGAIGSLKGSGSSASSGSTNPIGGDYEDNYQPSDSDWRGF